LIGCQRVTDGQTDGRTDRRTDVKPIAITCFSIADARKNKQVMNLLKLVFRNISEFITEIVSYCT